MLGNIQKKYLVGFLIVLSLSFIIIELPHLETGLPLHSDSYDNIAVVQQTIKNGNIFLGDPYAPPEGKGVYYYERGAFDLETGYILVLTLVSLLGISAETLPLFLPWLFALIAFFATFQLLNLLCRNDSVAFFASLFIFFIPSSQKMLGPLFLVASSFALILVPVLLYLGFNAINNNKYYKLFGLALIVSLFIYPPAPVISIIALLSYLIISPPIFAKNKRKLIIFGVGLTALFVMYILFLVFAVNLNPFSLFAEHGFSFIFALIDFILDQLILRETIITLVPFLDIYLGLPLFLFGIVSIIYFFWMEFKKTPNKNMRLIFVPAIILSLMVLASLLIGRGILVPTERIVLFAAYFLLLSTGVFAAEIFVLARNFLIEKKLFKEMNSKYFFVITILLLGLIIIASAPAKIESLQPNIKLFEFDGIQWINENTNENDLILAAPYISKPIRVFTGRNVSCTTKTRFGCSSELNFLASSFFFASCDEKRIIIDSSFNADYVLVQREIVVNNNPIIFPEQDCEFLDKMFEGENIIIYKTQRR